MRGRRGVDSERGDSLIEIIISIAILGVTAVAIFSGISLSIHLSDSHRKQTTASLDVRNYAEAVESAVAANYVPTCTPNYASGFTLPPADKMTATIVAVSFWNGTSFPPPPAPCNSGTDVGVQRLTLRVSSTDGRASEQLVIIVRCGSGSSCA